jgi:glycosyltransferase involved in cell wall biosynthesis
MPRVTVVIPSHNRADLLAVTLESVRNQTFADWECIVVDDHSTDDALEIAQRFARADSRFKSVPLTGPRQFAAYSPATPSPGRNHGMSVATGDLINFLDSDDLMAADKLELQVAEFDKDPTLDVVGCRHARFSLDPATDATQDYRYAPQSHWIEFLLGKKDKAELWQTGCPLYRTQLLRDLGGWSDDSDVAIDMDIDLRVLLHGAHVIRLDRILLFFRRAFHNNLTSLGSSALKLRWGCNAILENWDYMESTGQATELRRRLACDHFYRTAWVFGQSGKRADGVRLWWHDTGAVGQGRTRTFVGIALLLLNFAVRRRFPGQRLASWMVKRLEAGYFRHQELLPSLLPSLDGIPVPPPSER